ncbi:unnamed protein product, partial [Scytosiphon promiscuus]
MTIQDLTFMDFKACAIEGSGHAGENPTFISGNLVGTQTKPMLGDENVRAPTPMTNIKVFLHGDALISNAALLRAVAGASNLFLATTSGINHSTNYNGGVVFNGGGNGFNLGCNLNGTCTSTTYGGVI